MIYRPAAPSWPLSSPAGSPWTCRASWGWRADGCTGSPQRGSRGCMTASVRRDIGVKVGKYREEVVPSGQKCEARTGYRVYWIYMVVYLVI